MMAEAAMPMMVERRFKAQFSSFNKEAGVVEKGSSQNGRLCRGMVDEM
jgi:hypothetical protein